VGPGRGSAAGSAVAYCLGITQIDPIKYDLLFERFLNPDRISLPDIDIDFDDDGRGRVLNWVTQKYGKEKVAHIITYGTMATKMALKDVARVQKLPLKESDRLCKLVPDRIPDKKINLANAIEYVPELKAAEESEDPVMSETIKYARMLEGNVRGTGVHACGTIICRDDITDWVPVSTADDKETGEKMLVTQYEGSVIEDTGLIKMDFLGLKTLSIIKDAVANIKRTRGVDIDIDSISIDDPTTYKLFCDGGTIGTFQFESPGMQKYLRELKPSTFEDLIAMNALYRPGPMDYIPDFIDRKHGRKPIVYDIDIMEKYLKDTYGITVYQEQVMLLSRLLGGFTRGESDTLRKAMGKKIKSKLDELKPKFINGGQANGHNPDVLEKIWADWEKFASYAFNKSHATCYSWVAYQTAYLKANYPSEYMAAVLSRNLADIKQITAYMTECKHMGIKVLGPDINESIVDFSSNRSGDIRFGLAAVKGVGEAAVKSIIEEREKNGPYKNIYDFVERVNFSVINRKCMENLAYAGGFDSIIDFHRSKFFAEDARSAGGSMFIELLMRYGQRVQQERQNSQQSLFGGGDVVDIQPPTVPVAEDWNQLQVLNKEREMIGLYLSSHPLDEYKVVIKHMCKASLADLSDLEPFSGQELGLAGVVTSVQAMTTKTGRPWGKFTLEDYNGGVREFALFGKDYEQFRPMMYPNYFLFIKGKVQPRPYGDNPELEFKILSMTQLSQVRDELIKELHIVVPVEELTSSFTQEFSQMVQSNKGNTVLRLSLVNRAEGVTLNMFSKRYKVAMTADLVDYLDKNELKFTLS
ncbi:MAG: DNA polymerase III subunit alpha, partial [Alistipes sp.]|nr:DNA polymerase III subunit alpha [Alistipes sp.]